MSASANRSPVNSSSPSPMPSRHNPPTCYSRACIILLLDGSALLSDHVRMDVHAPTARLSRSKGALIGLVAAMPAAAIVVLVFVGPYPGFALTLAGTSLASGIVSGAT